MGNYWLDTIDHELDEEAEEFILDLHLALGDPIDACRKLVEDYGVEYLRPRLDKFLATP